MIEIKLPDNLLKELGKESKTNQKENPPTSKQEKISFNEVNQKNNTQKKDLAKNNNKNTDRDRDKEKNVISNSKINKAKTFETGKRTDRFGNMIIHGGNHKVTFIDRVSKNNFTEVVKVENFKEYNKMEEISNNKGNGCCFIL
jgi:hypothetical protein